MKKILIFILLSINAIAQQTVTFEQPAGTNTWTEGGVNWTFSGGNDNFSTISFKNGNSSVKTVSSSNSFLISNKKINISGLWVKFQNIPDNPAYLKAYDSLGIEKYSYQFVNIGDFFYNWGYLNLTWNEVYRIKFQVLDNLIMIPPGDIIVPQPIDVYYDDLQFGLWTPDTTPPTIMCFNYAPNGYCNSYSVPDLRSNLMVSDNISQWNAISITQSIAVGTVITKDSLVSFTATDAAGNSASCSYILKINKNTNSTQNISANTSYKDISNVYHYNSETFQNTIPNYKGCDSVITTNLTINQVPNILNFDVAPNLTSWNEDGKTWIWDGSTDKVSNISTKAGYGAGRASSNTTSKLVFPVNLNISKIWINGQVNASMMPLSGQMRGYDDNGNILYTLPINQTSGFEQKVLNWENVKSIGFTVSMGEMMMPGGMPGFPGGNTPVSMDVYYDEMEYSIYSPIPDTTPPSIVCTQSVISANTCDFFVLPNLTLGNTVSDNISSVSNIFISQSIPFGTVISRDTTVFIIATDEAGNSDTCSVQFKTKKSSTSIQNVNSITSFKDVLGQFHYQSGSFVVVIPNSAGCDSTITYNLSLSQTPNVLNFDVAPNLSSWNEDGKSWSWTSGTDKIGNGSNAKAGNGFGSSISGSNSKLLFAEKLNLTNIWVLYPIMGLMQPAAQLKGYDENQQEIYSQNITPNSSYQNLSLTWSNVASIAFSIPNVMVQSGGSPMPTSNPQTIYFDELGYTEYIPDITPPIIVFCPPNEFVCENTPLKDYTSSVIASDLNGIASITQTPLPGSTVYPGGQSVTITVMDNAGLTSNCQLVAYTNPSTSSTLNVEQYESFISPLGNVYSSSGTFNETLVNHYGCDSIVTINYTRLVLPPASLEPILNFDKDIYCIKYFPDSVAHDSVFISVSCPQDATIQWFDSDTSYVDGSNTRILHSFNSDYLNYGYFPKYLLRCKSSTDSSAFIDVSNGVNIGSSFGFPELKLNDNIVQNNHVENWCSILPISLVPTCYGNSVVNWIGETPSENPFYLNTSKTYTFYCDYATGCDGLPFSIHFVLPSAETGIPNATVLTEDINNCTEYVSIGFSGCNSNKYFLYESELNPNVAMSYSGENVNLPFTGNKTYKVYCGTFCSKSLTYDSIVIEAGITNIVLNAPIVNNDSINFCEKNSFVNYLNSKSCSAGQIIWKRKNINGIDENWQINAFLDFSEGDTLRLVCKFGNCVSSETIYKVNYKTSYPKPIINSIETVFCEGKEIVLSSPSCSSPDYYPNWKVFNDIYNTSTYFNTPSISVYLDQGTKVSLACVKNNVSYYCGSDTTLFIPQFVDNTLITNIQSSKDTLCHGETFNVTYTLEDTFPIGNVFTIQLSNELGDFLNPVIIGSGTSANQTTITVTLPQEIVAGNQYKIRVVPSLTNLGPGEFLCYIKEYPITILGSGAARLYNNNPFNCQGSQINLSAFSPYFNTYINDRSIRFFKNNIDITDESKTEQKDKYLKTYAENTDAGEYHVEMQYNGCSLKSANLNISFSVENNAPSIPDTTINVQRGTALNLAGTCSSYLLISPSTYAFYAPNPRLVVNNFKNFADTTFYVACATGGCISDYRKVEISVFDPVNAPNAPILTVNIDSVCLNNEYYNNPQIVSATGCNGSIEWHIGNILEYPFETDIQAPYQLIVPYGKKIYANCIENGIMSKGFGQIDLNQIQTLDGHIPVISPTVYVNSPEQFTLTAGQNAPVHLEVEEYIKDGNTGSRHKYCSDGIIKWFDSEFNLLKSGKALDTLTSTSNIMLYQACERGGKCEDKKRLIKVTVVDSVFINPSKSEYYICGSGSAILKANSCVSSNVKWYSDAQGMNLIQTGNNYITQNYLNVGITNIIDTFYVACNSGSFQTALKPVRVISSPVPQIPTVQDTLVNCNTPVVKAPIVNSCLSIEEPQWYLGGTYNSIMKEELYTGSVFSYSLNYDFRNIPVTYNVSCKNKLTTCESGVKQYSIIFDCTPPMPPIIEIENQTSIIIADKGGVSLPRKETLAVNEFCVGELVSLTAQNCVSGTIFWSDGYVGSPRSYNVKNGYINLVAVCKTDNYLKSESSNGLEFQSKPTPYFTLVDSVYSTSLVNLTADSVLTNLVLPVGSTMSYFSDPAFSNTVANPENIEVSGNYFIKATATNACSFSDNVVVIIDNCGRVIGYYSPTDDIFNGNVDAKTRKQITAENKISNTARASFRSESNILLRPGFEAKPNGGGIFKAEIGGCQ